ncbi:CBL-interacting protein kinase 15 [Diplonema papillatum]|nr:CBL-interacting protein kinase 15 [Diplonema papillatum]
MKDHSLRSKEGQQYNGYVFGKRLGSGKFGIVHEAWLKEEQGKEEDDRDKFAVKVMSKTQLKEAEMEDSLWQEIQIVASLDHPNITRMIDVVQSGQHVYITFEKMDKDLFDVLASRRLPEETARDYFKQLISAVSYCHRKGIAHRDLKPENLLLNEDETVLKISDFGLSTVQEEGTLLRAVVGSPHYLAPEVLGTSGYDGFGADMWSCGVILYVMMAGEMPFDGPTVMETLQMIVDGRYETPVHFSFELKCLIRKLLDPSPWRRASPRDVEESDWWQDGAASARLLAPEDGSIRIHRLRSLEIRHEVSPSCSIAGCDDISARIVREELTAE